MAKPCRNPREDFTADLEAGEAAVAGLVAAVELRDGHCGGHGQDVFDLAVAVGRELDVEPETLYELGLAAQLHDVGKLAVDESILQKPGPLTAEEWEIVREHPAAGAAVLAEIPGLEDAARMVRAHHERFDGFGYPDGLRGEEIPLGGRILAACDAYRAMVEERPYRPRLTPEGALHELERERGGHFDGRVVEALARVLLAAPALRE
jgi:HD-GYP domain-containing protein (c-di-GMP phosphodiesterase class II)